MRHKYQILKTSWGIVIFLDAEEIINPVIEAADSKIAHRIYLRIDHSIKWNPEIYKPWIERGIKALTAEIYRQIGNENSICFYIRSIDFKITDFQEEGFYCAIQEWIAVYYGLDITPINVVYDGGRNRYVFDMPFVNENYL